MGKPLQYHVFVAYLGVHQKLDQVHLDRWTQDVILWNWHHLCALQGALQPLKARLKIMLRSRSCIFMWYATADLLFDSTLNTEWALGDNINALFKLLHFNQNGIGLTE